MMSFVRRFVRISAAMLLACLVAVAVHRALGLGSDFAEAGWGGLVDLSLLAAAILFTGLSDREYFLGQPPKRKRRIDSLLGE
jgi:hypothetical protein